MLGMPLSVEQKHGVDEKTIEWKGIFQLLGGRLSTFAWLQITGQYFWALVSPGGWMMKSRPVSKMILRASI